MLWGGKEALMAWIRLFENDAPEGEQEAVELEVLSLPDVGNRIAIYRPEGEVVVFEVLGPTYEIVVDEDGDPVGEERVTLDVERLTFVPNEEELAPEQSHQGVPCNPAARLSCREAVQDSDFDHTVRSPATSSKMWV